MEKAKEVFIYCAPEDESMLQELLKHLQVFQQQNIITIWHNHAMLPGADSEQEIDTHFNQAEYILFLISPDFMNAHYGYSPKVQRALERHHQGTVLVIPVILRPVHWQDTSFGKLQALPRRGIPITSEKWHHIDDAFYNIVEGLKQVLEKSDSAGTFSPLPTSVDLEKDLPSSEHEPAFSLAFPRPRWGQSLHQVFTSKVIWLIVPAATTTLLLVLLLLVQIEPEWCLSTLCAPPPAQVATHPGEVRDANLDAYLVKVQSTSFELPGDLSKYTLQNLPSTIAAVRSDDSQANPYRLVIGATNLHSKGYGIYIEHVDLVILAVPPLANPLNIWTTSSLTYDTNPYFVIYKGEAARSVLQAGYEPAPKLTNVHQLLAPGEVDNIDLQISPKRNLQADLLFQVRIVYRMSNEEQEQSLTLPNHFEVVFSTASNWHVHTF